MGGSLSLMQMLAKHMQIKVTKYQKEMEDLNKEIENVKCDAEAKADLKQMQ